MENKVCFNENYPVIKNSDILYERAKKLIPSQTQTLAKGPGQYTKGIAPKYLLKGKGSHVWDVDGNEYLDYNMGIGPLSLGYCYDKVDNAIREQLENGITFSMMHPLEVEIAELIHEIIPNAEAIRYSKTGADVTSAAIRLARAYTKRNKILCCGYHGWHDWYIAVTDRNNGIPSEVQELTYTFNYNDIEGLIDSIDDDIAAIILEPVVFDEPQADFLYKVRDICNKNGIVLIFDEMWTGFRMALGGAQEYFGIVPDLATYSKAIANGMPIAVLTGRADIMSLLEKDVFFFTTFGGEALSLAAAKATINELRDKKVPEYLFRMGEKLKRGINELIFNYEIDFLECIGYNFRTMIKISLSPMISLKVKTYIQQEMIKNGIIWAGYHNLSYSHSDEDINYTLEVYKRIFPKVKSAIEQDNIDELIKGEILEPVFRKTSNFNVKPVVKV